MGDLILMRIDYPPPKSCSMKALLEHALISKPDVSIYLVNLFFVNYNYFISM